MIYDKPAKPGDLKKFKVEIDGKDVSDAVLAAQVFQDVFTPTWSAQVNFNDTANLLMILPIRSGSAITIEIETDNSSPADGSKKFEMVVYKIGDKQFQNYAQQSYTVFCADESFILNQTKRIQKAYSNVKATDAASKIVQEFLNGSLDTDASDNTIDFIVPNWTPFITTAWLLKVAIRSKAADYVFFQRDNHQFVMKSIENLYASDSESTGITLKMIPGEIRKNGDYDEDYCLAVSNYQFEHFDGMANLASGYYKNKLVSYDLISKKWEEKIFTFGDDCAADAAKKPWSNALFDDAENANISFSPKHPGMSNKPTILDTVGDGQTSRKSAIQKLDQERLLVQLPGSAGMHKWIGKNINFDLPSQEDMTGEKYDKQRRGKYLIVAIAHMIGKDSYSCNLELCKKRLESV